MSCSFRVLVRTAILLYVFGTDLQGAAQIPPKTLATASKETLRAQIVKYALLFAADTRPTYR